MVTTDNHKVYQLLQAWVTAIQFDQACHILHTVQPSHREDDWLILVLQHKSGEVLLLDSQQVMHLFYKNSKKLIQV
jgi:hypothetical protein